MLSTDILTFSRCSLYACPGISSALVLPRHASQYSNNFLIIIHNRRTALLVLPEEVIKKSKHITY